MALAVVEGVGEGLFVEVRCFLACWGGGGGEVCELGVDGLAEEEFGGAVEG